VLRYRLSTHAWRADLLLLHSCVLSSQTNILRIVSVDVLLSTVSTAREPRNCIGLFEDFDRQIDR
jgi:hypothetical protein